MMIRFPFTITWDRLCPLLLVSSLTALFLCLAAQTFKPHHWSDWEFGDAQTLLTLNQWQKQGWLHNYLLFKPQGYAPQVDLLDQPGLRQHAHGISPEASPNVGPRLWYTHYPSGYLVPYALLFKFGLDSRQALQLFSLAISCTALLLMYHAFTLMTSPVVALAAVVFYGTSTRFTGYADSLANLPVDDLLRFAFMLAVVLSTRASANHRRWLFLAWCLAFFLSLSSFDSVFFLYLWLIGWDLLESKGLRWQKWLIFALAPLTAHSLQFLQNGWYLGFNDALLDIRDTYLTRHTTPDAAGLPGHLRTILPALRSVFSFLDLTGFGLPLLLVLYLACRTALPDLRSRLPSFRLLLLLFLCGFAFVAVLPKAAMMEYEGRQMIPFTAMLAGSIVGSLVYGVEYWRKEAFPARSTFCLGLNGLAVILLVTVAVYTRSQTPVQESKIVLASADYTDHLFAQGLQDLPTAHDPIYFVAGRALTVMNPHYAPGYPQIHALLEHYAGNRLILCFLSPPLLVRDLTTLLDRSSTPFSPVLIAARPEYIAETVALLGKQGRLSSQPQQTLINRGLYLLDLTPFLK